MTEKVRAPLPRWAVTIWVLLLLALVGLLACSETYGRKKEEAAIRRLVFAGSQRSADDLASCLADQFPLTNRKWDVIGNGHYRRWNNARGVMVDIYDYPQGRRIEISTPNGRPLRNQEAVALRSCIAKG